MPNDVETVLDAIVLAPLISTVQLLINVELLYWFVEIVTSATVPVATLTLGFVPPLANVAVKDADDVLPSAIVVAVTGVIHTHAAPL